METKPFRKILVPTDLSKFSEPAVCLALSLGKALGSELVFIHVWPPEFDYEEELKASHDGRLKQLREETHQKHMRALEEFVGLFDAGSSNISYVMKSGPPYLAIAMAAKEFEAELIIMGTHGRSGFAHVLIGSVAEKVVRTAHCPVLTVKPEGFRFEEICAMKPDGCKI